MPTITHIATYAGQSFKRVSSSGRVYSHVVIGRVSLSHALERARAKYHGKSDANNFAYYVRQAAGEGLNIWQGHSDEDKERIRLERQASAIQELQGCTTPEDYVALKLAQRLAKIERQREEGYYSRFNDLGWASRYDLAQKNAGSKRPYHEDIFIIEPSSRTAKYSKAEKAKQALVDAAAEVFGVKDLM